MVQLTKQNNFDFLRLCFALFVMITHSYSLTGLAECDPLCKITTNGSNLSKIGVHGFFAISGYLIFLSATRSKSLYSFLVKRFLRVFPALAMVLFLTLVAIVLFNSNNIELITSPEFTSYFFNNLSLYKLQMSIQGVFENNPYPHTINGCLWTLKYEFTFYLFCSVFVYISSRIIQLIILSLSLLILISIYFYLGNHLKIYGLIGLNGDDFVRLLIYFGMGALLAATNLYGLLKLKITVFISFILLIFSLFITGLDNLCLIALPIFVISFGINSFRYISRTGESIGDLSYGIYIYGFVTQQFLMDFKLFSVIELTIYSIIITIILSFGSWHLIESRALRLKSKLT